MIRKTEQTKPLRRSDMLYKAMLAFMVGTFIFTGCGADKETNTESEEETDEAAGEYTETEKAEGIAGETAVDTEIDFEALQAENADIFAWLYIPDTKIDYPVLQSEESDDYYENHNAYGETDTAGAVYTELANLRNMCDFNTVFHGKTNMDGSGGSFSDLYRFSDPDFFADHEEAYLYLEGNLLTYEIIAAFERDNTSLIRTYDFTYISGCQKFLDDMYGTRIMGMNLREGWENITPYHFLITLTTQKGENPEKQFVVIGALVDDAAGTVDRIVSE